MKKLEVQLVIDKDTKKSDVEKIFSIIKKGFQEKVGKDVDITVKRVEKIHRKMSRIVTKVNKNNFEIKEYI